MRVIAGRFKGTRLYSPPAPVRPTTDRLREALFSMLGRAVQGSVWLDLFAGSGAVGIEALSRGADRVVFNDKNAGVVSLLRKNLLHCRIREGFEIFQEDAMALLNRLEGPFDFVFLDPPYDFERYEQLLQSMERWQPKRGSFRVLLEVFKKTPLDFVAPPWSLDRILKAGDSHLAVISPGPGSDSPENMT